jgi:hypothetical protein
MEHRDRHAHAYRGIRGVYGHDRARYGLIEPLYPATRIL